MMRAPNKSVRAPNPAAVRAARKWVLRDAIGEYGLLLESHGRSISEAAFQSNDSLIRIHLRSNHLVFKAAVEAFRELVALDEVSRSEGAEAEALKV